MKKQHVIFLLFFLVAFKGYSKQIPPLADYFAGKWELLLIGIPDGDKKMTANFTRVDGKLSGELSTEDPQMPKIPIANIEEGTESITVFFSAQGYDVNIVLQKLDEENMKGSLMGMFEVKAKRIP